MSSVLRFLAKDDSLPVEGGSAAGLRPNCGLGATGGPWGFPTALSPDWTVGLIVPKNSIYDHNKRSDQYQRMQIKNFHI